LLADLDLPSAVSAIEASTHREADWSAVEEFAGPGPDRAVSVVPVAARQVLKRYGEHSRHYEIVARFTAS